MVHRRRHSRSSTNMAPATSLTPLLLRKSRKTALSRLLVHQQHAAEPAPLLPPKRPLFSDGLLRVPGSQALRRPRISRSGPPPAGSSSGAASCNQPAVGPPSQFSVCLSRSSSALPNASPLSLWQSAAGGYSFQFNKRSPSSSSLRSTNLSFYSAQESLYDHHPPLDAVPVISKDFILPPEYKHDHPQARSRPSSSRRSAPSDPSPPSDPATTDESSFYCRGLSSSQIIQADSNSQPSDPARSQVSHTDSSSQSSDQARSQQPSESQSSDRGAPAASDSAISQHDSKEVKEEGDNHHEASFEVTRRPVSHSQDELVINIKKRASANNSDHNPSPRTAGPPEPESVSTLIPHHTHLADNSGLFRCPFVRRMAANLGPDFLIFNDKRKKLQSELLAKIRTKFQRDQPHSPKKSPQSSSSSPRGSPTRS
ncbi:hypothetical protein PtA15_4A16 [Puccinia triticina]|uniref:Uncharacterized protein n=1 Tax=Puccinia triticina TaxID=208348 RepID=A0ABY7CFA1_9BASI|nr:uncharacterized protein PtA15_4A16 [Puccinia triticina]WAQ83568.1 hypothetical protein PtA15_4A16 [Puccinia triticina]WAR54400.1 hypothetical protein PtB15_4B17 [Puccinia triticina]